MSRAFALWSGGKDSHYAVYRALQAGLKCELLLSFVDETTELMMTHRLPPELIEEQARLMDRELLKLRVRRETFERELRNTLFDLRSDGYTVGVFSIVSDRALRDYYQTLLAGFDMRAVFPLWGVPASLLLERQRKLLRVTIVQIDRCISESYLGRELTQEFLDYLEEEGVELCGEGGEYETFVCSSPLMKGEIFLTHADRRATPQAVGLEIDYWKVEG